MLAINLINLLLGLIIVLVVEILLLPRGKGLIMA